jgi:hypothetical protein
MQRKIVLATATLACAVLTPLTPLAAAPANAVPVPKKHPVEEIKADVAEQLQAAMVDGVARRVLYKALADKGQANLVTVFAHAGSVSGDRFMRQATVADADVKQAKGLEKMSESTLQVRLADPAMASKLADGVPPLFAAAPSKDDTEAVDAKDIHGQTVRLDLAQKPDVPLILVDLDVESIVPAAVDTVREELQKNGVESDVLPEKGVGSDEPDSAAADGQASEKGKAAIATPPATKIVTRLNNIRLNDDEEPWWKGKAEIYGIAMGQGKDGKARADVVDMPYLNYSGSTYSPNQGIIDWSNFRWNHVDFLLMEQDDNTNYKDIAKAVAAAIATLAGGSAYVPLINAVLDALPSSWWTDDDDYVDSFYMVARTYSGTKWGASNNARININPVIVTT